MKITPFRKALYFCLLAVAALVVAAGCKPAQQTANVDSGAKKVAVFKGGDITQAELQQQIDALAQQSGQGSIKPGSPQYKAAVAQVMPNVVALEISKAYAKEHGIKVSRKEIDKGVKQQIDQIKQQLAQQAQSQGQTVSADQAYQQALQQANLTEKELKKRIREQIPQSLLVQKVEKKVVGDTTPSKKEIKTFYDKNKKQFQVPEQRCTRHILFNKDQKKLAEETKKKLQKDSSQFGKLAKKYSQDPGSAAKGGDLGCLTSSDQLVPEFKSAVFKAKKGEIVGPIKTQFGYHLIEVTDIKKAKTEPLSKVSPQIKSQLSGQEQSKKFQAWIEKQKKQRNLKYLNGYKPPKAGATSGTTSGGTTGGG